MACETKRCEFAICWDVPVGGDFGQRSWAPTRAAAAARFCGVLSMATLSDYRPPADGLLTRQQLGSMLARRHALHSCSYLKREMGSTSLHTRFAHIWNEIVDAMRDEDILSNQERLQVRQAESALASPRSLVGAAR